MPRNGMTKEASELTGIKICNDEMYVNEVPVTTFLPREAFISFLYFLKRRKKPCILVAHNGYRFDIPRLCNLAKALNLFNELVLFVKGVCDTLPLFRNLLHERKVKKESFKQADLARDFLDKTDNMNAHNALNDVLVLEKLLYKICECKTLEYKSTILHSSSTLDYVLNAKIRKQKTKERRQSLSVLQISNCMVGKIIKAGIDINILQEACKTGGLDGLTILLGENVNNKPKVTLNKKIIATIFKQLNGQRENLSQ